MSEGRPSPEALLAATRGEGRGRLKLFIGAAPGVGKTFEMLQSAQAKRREGVDVVVGVVETHGRKETEALIEGLELVPRRRVDYKGRSLDEMDLDALLARKPRLALVDELAHTNAPGSRHPKRYMDVEELLAAGIDVYTTLNVQHIESLNDVVARITRIRVRETVPDSVIDRADDIEVIDITPADLIQRLREGKVYVPHQAERAVKHYFKPGNLTALRELALRRTAARVDEQMVEYMQAHAIAGPWDAGERVLVCVNEEPGAADLVRHARRLADRLRARWTAIYVETPRHHRMSDAERDRVAETLRLAGRLGGDALSLPGTRVVAEVLTWARANNITQIVVGRARAPRWSELVRGTVTSELVRDAGDISVHVMAGEERAAGDPAHAPAAERAPFDARPYGAATAVVAAAIAIGVGLQQWLDVGNLALVFLTAIVVTAIGWGLGPSLWACGLSVAAYNFFFLPPYYNFTISDPENVVGLVFFLIVAVLVSNLTARTRQQMLAARLRAKITAELYAFSRKLAGIGSLDDLLWATAFQIASMLHVRVVLLLPDADGRIEVRAGYPPEDELDEADLAAAKWCWENKREAGRHSDTLPGARRLFVPWKTGRSVLGVIGIDRDEAGPILAPDQRRLMDALVDQAAVAVERVRLAADVDAARIVAETERMRSALLASVSHDLKTPLASIIGAVTSLPRVGAPLAPAQAELAQAIREEAERLERFIGNLLDVTRLESGALRPTLAPVDIGEVVETALRRASRVLADDPVSLDIPDDLPLVQLDFLMLEQVLFNLLDNAAKYAGSGTRILIAVRRRDGGIAIEVQDEGPGIPAGEEERIFDKFYRLSERDFRRVGTGLGLSICRGFVEAMGGRIAARNRADRSGALFSITFPESALTQASAPEYEPADQDARR